MSVQNYTSIHYWKQWVKHKRGNRAHCSLLLFSHTQSFPHSFLSQSVGKRHFLTVFLTEKKKELKGPMCYFSCGFLEKALMARASVSFLGWVEPRSFQGNHHPIECSWKWYSVSMILISTGSQTDVWLTHVNLPVFNGWKLVKYWEHPIIPFHRYWTTKPHVSESFRVYEDQITAISL